MVGAAHAHVLPSLIYGQISVRARTDRHARGCGQVIGQTETRSRPLEHIFQRRERKKKALSTATAASSPMARRRHRRTAFRIS